MALLFCWVGRSRSVAAAIPSYVNKEDVPGSRWRSRGTSALVG